MKGEKKIFHRYQWRRKWKREKNGRFVFYFERITGLTGCQPAGCFQLQFLDLFDQQGDVLQQVGVLLQQPLHSRLGISASVHLDRQLLLKNVDLSRMTWMSSTIKKKQPSKLLHQKCHVLKLGNCATSWNETRISRAKNLESFPQPSEDSGQHHLLWVFLTHMAGFGS